MSNKNKSIVLVYRPMGGNEDPTTGKLTPYHDTYNQCEVIAWSYSYCNPYIIFLTTSQNKTTKVTAVGMPYVIVEDAEPEDCPNS